MNKREAHRYVKERLLSGLSHDVCAMVCGGFAEDVADDLEVLYDRTNADEIVNEVFYEVAEELERHANRLQSARVT